MKKITLFCLLLLCVESLSAQFPSKCDEVKLRASINHAPNTYELDGSLFKITARKKLNAPNFKGPNYSSGYQYKIEIVAERDNFVIKSKRFNPSNSTGKSGLNWIYSFPELQVYHGDFDPSHGSKVYARVSILRYVSLNFGGFQQPPSLFSTEVCAISESRILGVRPGGSNGNNGKPNLTLSKFSIKNNGSTYIPHPNGQAVNITQGKDIDFEITFKNDGKAKANSCEYRLYISDKASSTNLPSNSFLFASGNAGSITPGGTRKKSIRDRLDSRFGQLVFSNGKRYYFYLEIDYRNRVKETDESNRDNFYRIDFTYKKSGSSKPPCRTCLRAIVGDGFSKTEPYAITVYDFTGKEILSKWEAWKKKTKLYRVCLKKLI